MNKHGKLLIGRVFMNLLEQITNFIPLTEQEKRDQYLIMENIKEKGDMILTRQCPLFHMSSSSMIMNQSKTHVLMIFHNIYNSWSWTGGHTDGDSDLIHVAIKEAQEETGVESFKLCSNDIITMDILPVPSHFKNHVFISSHLHFNVCYGLTADDTQKLTIKEDENSNVGWIPIDKLERYVTETSMIPIYDKIIQRMLLL